ncbi:hypothetical protein BD311DRAFT_349343 [Dichomitus squalens]|uniref:Uncharacterized protein n=1 Tax=Dichomitus squalens TaxID=114155 RepID=A0A4Q9N5C9_9APHY|nr:hypothetical protein BD311DRAFT_349343 [Dichomitus squalens]
MRGISFVSLAPLLGLATVIKGQRTNATCVEQYDWLDNSLGQSPCLVTAYMYTACQTCNTTPGNDCFVSALDPGIPYTVYSMLAACAVCQGGGIWDIVPFSDFSSSCVDTQIELYPFATPSGTAIPPWASLPLVVSRATVCLILACPTIFRRTTLLMPWEYRFS